MKTTTMVFNHPDYGKLTTEIRDGEVYLNTLDLFALLENKTLFSSSKMFESLGDLYENSGKIFTHSEDLKTLINSILEYILVRDFLYNVDDYCKIKNLLQEYELWIQNYVIPKAKAYKEGYQNKPKLEKESKTCSCGSDCKGKTLDTEKEIVSLKNKVEDLGKEISNLRQELKVLKTILDMISKIKSIGKI